MHVKAIDEWSPIHWVCGFAITWFCTDFGIDLMYVFLGLVLFEIIEYLWLGKALFGRLGLYEEESSINVISDIFFGFIGAVFGYYVFLG